MPVNGVFALTDRLTNKQSTFLIIIKPWIYLGEFPHHSLAESIPWLTNNALFLLFLMVEGSVEEAKHWGHGHGHGHWGHGHGHGHGHRHGHHGKPGHGGAAETEENESEAGEN